MAPKKDSFKPAPQAKPGKAPGTRKSLPGFQTKGTASSGSRKAKPFLKPGKVKPAPGKRTTSGVINTVKSMRLDPINRVSNIKALSARLKPAATRSAGKGKGAVLGAKAKAPDPKRFDKVSPDARTSAYVGGKPSADARAMGKLNRLADGRKVGLPSQAPAAKPSGGGGFKLPWNNSGVQDAVKGARNGPVGPLKDILKKKTP